MYRCTVPADPEKMDGGWCARLSLFSLVARARVVGRLAIDSRLRVDGMGWDGWGVRIIRIRTRYYGKCVDVLCITMCSYSLFRLLKKLKYLKQFLTPKERNKKKSK